MSRQTKVVVAYHEIAPEPSGYTYAVDCAQLRGHLEVLKAGGAFITFDDGHASHYRYAAPMLEEFGLHATFFVIASYAGVRPAFMSWQELRALTVSGHEVQSHGWSHTHLTSCSKSKVRDELTRSRATLEDKLGTAVTAISIPHGRWNRDILRACSVAGYKRVYVSDPIMAPWQTEDMSVFGRLVLRRDIGAAQLQAFLCRQGSWYWRFRAKYQIKAAAKQLLGDVLYHRLWCRLAGEQASAALHDEYVGRRQSAGVQE
jgi:hypothetical protein